MGHTLMSLVARPYAAAWIAPLLVACNGQAPNEMASDASIRPIDVAPIDAAGSADAGVDATAAIDATIDAATDATTGFSPCTSTVIGPAGGSLVHPSGAQIIVPVGALAAATRLSLCPEAALLAGAVGQAFEAGPEGQTFLRPVEVIIPFDPTRVSSGSDLDAVQMRMAPRGTSSFGALQSNVDLAAGLVRASTTHFSQFVPAQTSTPIFIATSPSLPQATVGIAYSQEFSASGGTPPYTWSVPSSTSLPLGLTLGSDGVLSGTPIIATNFAFFVEVTDSTSDAVELAVSLTVVPPNNPVPALTQVTPSSVAQGNGDTVITLTGTGFVPTAQALWDGTAISTTFVGATQLAATIPAADLLSAGSHQISVGNPSPGGGTSGRVSFTVTPAVVNPVPSIVSVAPTQLPISSVDVQIAITGSNFISTSSAVIGSQGIATSYTSPTQLVAVVPAAYLAGAGTLPIGVFNPAPGGGFSPTTVTVTVGTLNSKPVLTTLSPSSVIAGSGAFTLSLSGSAFVPGAQAFFGSTALQTTFVSSTSVQAAVPAYLVASAGSAQVVLANPTPGGGASGTATFTIGSAGDAGGYDAGWAWSEVPDAGASPGARLNGAMATLGAEILLFGGISQNAVDYGDTWTWNGSVWTQMNPVNNPSPRMAMAMGTLGNDVVLFGGVQENNPNYIADTWLWDGSDWANVSTAHSPSVVANDGQVYGYSMATLGSTLVMFGGYPNKTWIWDGTDWTVESPPSSPSGLISTTMAAVGTSIVLFTGNGAGDAGIGGAFPNQTWSWDGSTWTLLTPPASPTPRAWAAMATLGTNVFLFGGTIPNSPFNGVGDDTWMWSGGTWVEVTTTQGPLARTNPLMAPLGDALYLFGGGAGGTYFGDTWVFGAVGGGGP